MCTEFPGRFMRLFAGPMWSGQPIESRQDPRTVNMSQMVLLLQEAFIHHSCGPGVSIMYYQLIINFIYRG